MAILCAVYYPPVDTWRMVRRDGNPPVDAWRLMEDPPVNAWGMSGSPPVNAWRAERYREGQNAPVNVEVHSTLSAENGENL